MNKKGRDPLLGKDVLITGGYYKGYRGKVTRVDDKQAIVELASICKKIPIERNLVQDIKEVSNANGGPQGGDDYNQGGRTVYEGGKTPMQYNTPSYYPHSPHWGAGNSPAFGTERK